MTDRPDPAHTADTAVLTDRADRADPAHTTDTAGKRKRTGGAGPASGRAWVVPVVPLAVALAVALVPVGAPVAVAAPGAAGQDDPVELPVLPSVLDAGAPCTEGSTQEVPDEPPQQASFALDRVWRFGRGEGVKVAVVDTGVAADAPRLTGRVTDAGGTEDCVGHGSFLAGLVAAAPAEGTGFTGMAPGAQILAVRGTDAQGVADAASVASGIEAATDAGAEVVLVAAALEKGSAELTAAVERAVEQDALVVAPAAPEVTGASDGIDEEEAATPRNYWPAAAPGVLSVLGSDAEGAILAGAAVPREADLSAPGDGVIGPGPEGDGYFIGSGSSLAAAFVAGAAALIRGHEPGLTAEATAERLTHTAYPADVPRLDPYAAVTAIPSPTAPVSPPPAAVPPVRIDTGPDPEPTLQRARLLTAAIAAFVLLAAWAAVAVPRARARTRARTRAAEGTAPG
ncbi:S8 family serine peptidase [Streptomyces sp. NPDC056716]|uniref:S8 family serine peptidase n=1 Tax=unclassified Streptomyces TaxID=2593676 RepID=UPI0036814EAE